MTHPQSRILVLEMLTKAGSQGLLSEILMQAIMEIGLSESSAASRLYKDKGYALIFGKGAHLEGRMGITYRYFATAEFRDAYVFEGEITEETRRAKVRAYDRDVSYKRWKERMAAETPEQRATRLERDRARRYAKLGVMELPPLRAHVSLKDMTRDEFLAHNRAKQKAHYDSKRAQGLAPRKGRPAPKTTARLGAELVVKLVSREAPVRVKARPVLTGEPIITSATRVTVAPVSRDYRFWVDPATVPAVFGALPVGVYPELT